MNMRCIQIRPTLRTFDNDCHQPGTHSTSLSLSSYVFATNRRTGNEAHRPNLKALKGQKLTAIAWLWARTVKSPDPAFSHVDVPLTTTFILSQNR